MPLKVATLVKSRVDPAFGGVYIYKVSTTAESIAIRRATIFIKDPVRRAAALTYDFHCGARTRPP